MNLCKVEMLRKIRCLVIFVFIFSFCFGQEAKKSAKEKTSFQTSNSWKPQTDVRSDIAIVYGTNDRTDLNFEQRAQSWRNKGYKTHFMTGIAWGDYADYFNGKWDGKQHWADGQVKYKVRQSEALENYENGDTVWHHPGVPYIVPTASFIKYLKEKHVKRAIDAGIDAIYLEEPEFWAKSGYSESFKKEWKVYYGFPWKPQHESPQNTYLSNKLKYQLYFNALKEVFTYAKEYGKSKGMNVRCYVPTHSLINYSSWEIVSPEASLASLPCVDGYIGQIWTGTARTDNFFNGIKKERTFETAYLEYNCMESMVAPTNRKVIFLSDPIEDNAKDWKDYKVNYQATFTAKLLFPKVDNYEVMPWPDRIYEGLYTDPKTGTKKHIPQQYATQMQVMINTLNSMPITNNKVSGSHGIGVLMANSLMFQRYPVHEGYDDPAFSNFFGQVLPLLKRGIPIEIVHIENSQYPLIWQYLKVLVMSYSNMKPMKEDYHHYISEWVKSGGILIYCGKDIDPYQNVMEWWNTNGNNFKAPSAHLFKLMGIPEEAASGIYTFGKGKVHVIREEPKEFVLKANNDKNYLDFVKLAYEKDAGAGKLETKNNFYLERGSYIICSVLDETESKTPLILKGVFIDLFDPDLPVLKEKTITPNSQAFLFDVSKISDKSKPKVLCGASRVYNETISDGRYSFMVKSPINTWNVSRVYLPGRPQMLVVKNEKDEVIQESSNTWDELSKTCLLKFPNSPEGVLVEIDY